MEFKKLLEQINISRLCRRHGLTLWQCPQFLFLVMGLIIIGTAIITFFIGTFFVEDIELVALIVLILTAVLLTIASIIVNSFERLAEANRMKSEFISVVSHQLRAPLSNLKWAIELLMSGRLGPIQESQVDYFKILKENNNRMKELVNDLLVVSKIEQKALPLMRKEFSLKEMTEKLVSDFQPFAHASNVEVKIEAEENVPAVFGDFAQLRLVVENLLDNAIRYIKEKGEIIIKIKNVDGNVFFEIRDTGVGIPKEDQKYIFQKFFRSENALKYQTQGSGLGLYIAKAIIEKSGGKIGFESQEGKGTTFWFVLPVQPR